MYSEGVYSLRLEGAVGSVFGATEGGEVAKERELECLQGTFCHFPLASVSVSAG